MQIPYVYKFQVLEVIPVPTRNKMPLRYSYNMLIIIYTEFMCLIIKQETKTNSIQIQKNTPKIAY